MSMLVLGYAYWRCTKCNDIWPYRLGRGAPSHCLHCLGQDFQYFIAGDRPAGEKNVH